jgi:hypothetical protein
MSGTDGRCRKRNRSLHGVWFRFLSMNATLEHLKKALRSFQSPSTSAWHFKRFSA